MKDSHFEDKVAIVTGAAIGIGFEIASQLAAQGACIILNDIDEKAGQSAVEQLQKDGGRCEMVIGDSSDLGCIQAMVQQAVNSYGQVDIAIANAGITTFGSFLDYPVEQFQRLTAVNLQGTFFLAQKAAQQMIKQQHGGRILLMSSVTGHQFHPDLAAYGMSKAAIRMLTKTLGVELAPQKITVNAISPGATLTERTLHLEGGEFKDEWERVTPTGRAATTQDIAHTALFLLSPNAGQITGQTIVVDGGWTAVSPPPH
jgi:glucose 1-dehydrogenase